MCEECQWYKFVLIYMYKDWGERASERERGKEEKQISSLLSPAAFLRMYVSEVRVRLHSSTEWLFTLACLMSVRSLIIVNDSNVDRACCPLVKSKSLSIPFLSREEEEDEQLHSISPFIVLVSWANRTWQWPLQFVPSLFSWPYFHSPNIHICKLSECLALLLKPISDPDARMYIAVVQGEIVRLIEFISCFACEQCLSLVHWLPMGSARQRTRRRLELWENSLRQ